MFCRGRDNFVAPTPVDRGDAEVHAMGGVLGEGNVIWSRADEAGRSLTGVLPQRGLAGVEADTLEVGGARAEVVRGAHGLDHVVGRRTAAAGVQVDVVVFG